MRETLRRTSSAGSSASKKRTSSPSWSGPASLRAALITSSASVTVPPALRATSSRSMPSPFEPTAAESTEFVPDCLFCSIAAGEIPSTEVLSTDLVYAFRDLNPVAPTHVLVIPREHISDAAGVTAEHGEVLAEMFEVARRVAEADGVAERGYRLVFNVGEDSGNSVAHLHLHVLGGRRLGWPPG